MPNQTHPTSVWARKEIVKRFYELLADPKKLYGEIAQTLSREFGVVINKNAAIGFGRRANVPTRDNSNRGRKLPKPQPKLVVPKTIKRLPTMIPLEQLRVTSCRWPYGDRPPFLFCGAVQVEGCSYCEEHAKLVYVRRTRPAA